jgi:antagonist of KipI
MSVGIIRGGLLTTVQDLGRYGFQKHGVLVSGAMDAFALRLANLLVGNEEGAAALEITLMGPTLRFEQPTLIAIGGAYLSPKLDGKPVPEWRPVWVRAGSQLTFGAPVAGCRAYLAVAGGFAVPEVLGSRSTFLRGGIGGHEGRALAAGDLLVIGTPSVAAVQRMEQLECFAGNEPFAATDWVVSSHLLPDYSKNPVLRVMRGAQFDAFDEASRAHFIGNSFRVTPQSDRMGYRLQGDSLKLVEPLEMISEAVTAGTIQVPSDGNPIVLLADRQTTGGYPKIGQIATVDLPLIAQVKPGDTVRFQEISLSQAQELYVQRERELELFKQGITWAGR